MTGKKTFFIVDDDEDDLFFFEQALKKTDASSDLIKVINSTEVIKTLKSDLAARPDYIFLDLNMPKKGGKECLEDIRKEPSLLNIPVIIYSTSSSPEDKKELFSMGANHFLTKFSDFKELCNTLAHFVKGEMKLDMPLQIPRA